MTDEFLLRYIKGELDGAEREAVVSWIEAADENFRRFAALQTDEVFAGLEQEEMPAEAALFRLASAGWPGTCPEKRILPGWMTSVVRVAALLLLPLTVAGLLVIASKDREISRLTAQTRLEHIVPVQEATSSTYVVNPGVKGDITLPDGSRVRLNSASTLRCPDRFSDTCRVVELSGEGFFDVIGNPEWPMYVRTPKGVTVKVLGTRFNVSAYENDSALKLTLVEGSVTLIHDATDRHFSVRPNEEMVFRDGMRTCPEKKPVDVQPAIVWKEGVLLFENTRMDEVVRKLERWYGVSIDVQDPSILEMSFTASFESESLTQVLQLLKITSKLYSRIEGCRVTLSRK